MTHCRAYRRAADNGGRRCAERATRAISIMRADTLALSFKGRRAIAKDRHARSLADIFSPFSLAPPVACSCPSRTLNPANPAESCFASREGAITDIPRSRIRYRILVRSNFEKTLRPLAPSAYTNSFRANVTRTQNGIKEKKGGGRGNRVGGNFRICRIEIRSITGKRCNRF